ncbi:MAG: type II toxin-antitoxin system VapC family toxin [Deltaproteobacteria bacterium]|jgi:ribonuclease VapC|nr:type II toxin-antitoxin system VapC family toxin [Deltaproteobacteria bacterium]
MVIDTSALIAILLGESEAQRIASAIAGDPKKVMSSFSLLEAGIVIEAKKGEAGGRELDLLIHRCEIEVVNLTTDQSELARVCWRRFGKGRHPASLNIGDCCSYALSKYTNEPLLFKGEDFSKTDLELIDY